MRTHEMTLIFSAYPRNGGREVRNEELVEVLMSHDFSW